MSKLILLVGLILMGCEVQVQSQPQTSSFSSCEIQIEILHINGAENTIKYVFDVHRSDDCYRIAQDRLELKGNGTLWYRHKILATNVGSYKIVESTNTY